MSFPACLPAGLVFLFPWKHCIGFLTHNSDLYPTATVLHNDGMEQFHQMGANNRTTTCINFCRNHHLTFSDPQTDVKQTDKSSLVNGNMRNNLFPCKCCDNSENHRCQQAVGFDRAVNSLFLQFYFLQLHSPDKLHDFVKQLVFWGYGKCWHHLNRVQYSKLHDTGAHTHEQKHTQSAVW